MSSTRSIRIGNQTALGAGTVLAPFRFALRHRFGAFEWFQDHRDGRGFRFGRFDAAQRQRLRRLGLRWDLAYTVHADLTSSLLDPHDPGLEEAMRFARHVGAGLIVTHFPDEGESRVVATALEGWAGRAGEAGLCLTLENTVATGPDAINQVFRQLEPTGPARRFAGLCFDMGHANLHGPWRHDYIGYFDRLGPHVAIRHVHVHENDGDRDAHLPLFTGPSAADPTGVRLLLMRLHRRGYRGALIMEQWPDFPSRLCEVRHRLEAMLEALEPAEGRSCG